MKILIVGASGNIGAKIADILLSQATHRLRLCTRNPEKLVIEQSQGAEVVRGDLETAPFLVDAARGCDAMFLMIPPNDATSDYRNFQNRVAYHAAQAIRQNRIEHVVLLSASGAQRFSGDLGFVTGLNDAETLLRQAAPNLSILRPVFLMENYLLFLEEMLHSGRISFPVSKLVKTPMIAAQDVAEAAARLLNRQRPQGQTVIPLYGAADHEMKTAVELLGATLGRELVYEEISSERMLALLKAKGLGESYAGQLVDYFDALELGLLEQEQLRDELTTTPTQLAEFAQLVLAPILHSHELETQKTS